MEEHTEVERTYAPEPGTEVPDLGALDGVDTVGDREALHLRATYFDTGDLALLRGGVTLRRRTGGDDAGWHAKVPSGQGRREIHLPLSDEALMPPGQLVAMLRGWTHGAALAVMATVETRRTERQLRGEDGTVLAVLAEDEVTGTPADGGPAVCWCEWELELLAGGPELLEQADRLMAAAGVPASTVDRKILHVLGDRVPPKVILPEPSPARPAAELLQRRLVEQVAELHRRDVDTRSRDFAEGVHQIRIVCRRLRSALAAYRPLVDRAVTEPLRGELQWLGRELSVARDNRVIGEELLAMLATQPEGLVWGPVGARVARTLSDRGRREVEHVQAVLSSVRYDELLAALERLAEDPPWSAGAAEPAGTVVPRRLRKEWRRIAGRVAAIEAGPGQDTAVHAVRKAAKRMRYALEAAEPAWPKEAKRMRKAVKRLTTVLGERQDTVVARQHLVQLAADASAAGESTFTYGRLHGLEEGRAREQDAAFAAEWTRASRKKLRRWLS